MGYQTGAVVVSWGWWAGSRGRYRRGGAGGEGAMCWAAGQGGGDEWTFGIWNDFGMWGLEVSWRWLDVG